MTTLAMFLSLILGLLLWSVLALLGLPYLLIACADLALLYWLPRLVCCRRGNPALAQQTVGVLVIVCCGISMFAGRAAFPNLWYVLSGIALVILSFIKVKKG